VRGPRALACELGHAFDPARSGYVNLLQPQDKKSAHPGDDRSAVRARRRFLESGALAGLVDAITSADAPPTAPIRRLLDVGCGEGYFTSRLSRAWSSTGVGLDVSSEACDAAARAHPECGFVVGNADRELPFLDGSFDRAVSITARRNPAELARVLAPGGDVRIVVAGEDDLAELRRILHGDAPPVDRTPHVRAIMERDFVLTSEASFRTPIELDRSGIEDMLAMTYRGARHREAERAAGIDHLHTTLSARILCFRPRRG